MSGRKHVILPFRGVVLIADMMREPAVADPPFHLRRDLEKSDDQILEDLFAAFSELGLKVHHYGDPKTLSARAQLHKNDVIFTIYGGEVSRSRLALVPAICEAHGLAYVGPDAYGSILCHDKEVSKNIARQCGLHTPGHRLVRTLDDVAVLDLFPTPFVVKPLAEGSSIGISQRNLVTDTDDGIKLARELLAALHQPIMIEEFVSGREVSYNCIESHPEHLWSYSEIYVDGQERYFDTHLFDAEEKAHHHLPRRVITIDSELKSRDKIGFRRLTDAIGRFGYCRIDGKLINGDFIFLEITPDAWIGPTGAFAGSFMNKGWKYADIIHEVLASAALDLQAQ